MSPRPAASQPRHLSAAPDRPGSVTVEQHSAAGGQDDAAGARDSAPGRHDRAGWASITACPDGPLLVRGDVEILLADGSPAPRRRSTVALCRCGASGIKPYCDGSHKVVGFTTADEPACGDVTP